MDRKNYTPAKYVSPNRDNIEFGPAMSALNPRQQAVVLYIMDTGTDNWTEAVQAAGYGEGGSYEAQRVTASRLRRDPKIGLALNEIGRSRPSFDLPMALRTIRTIAADPSHKDAGKMALALAGMSGVSPVARSQTETTVTHTLDPMAAMEAKLRILESSSPETAALLRAQLMPRTMIDVTPLGDRSTAVGSDLLPIRSLVNDVFPRNGNQRSPSDYNDSDLHLDGVTNDGLSPSAVGDLPNPVDVVDAEMTDAEADDLLAGLL